VSNLSPLIAVAGMFAVVAAYYWWVTAPASRRPDADTAQERFADYSPTSPLLSGLSRIARPVARTRAVADLSSTPMLRVFAAKVEASGLFGRSTEVFLAYQVAAVLVAVVVGLLALFAAPDFLARAFLSLFAVGVGAWPYDKVRREAARRAEEATQRLPEFVELLLINISSGKGVQQALEATAPLVDGVVSDAARWLLDNLAARTMSEAEAYSQAGKRIGSPDAIAFFNSLYQAQVQGAQVTDNLRRQADSLRVKAHQERRAKIKRVPVKMIVAFAIHLLPLLFVLVMIPLLVGLGNL
jgi:Flp pilus assembly protein TadB